MAPPDVEKAGADKSSADRPGFEPLRWGARGARGDMSAKTLFVLAALVVVIIGLRNIGPVVLPILTAGFIAAVSAPVMGALMRLKVPAPLAVGLTCLLDIGIVVGVAALVATSLTGLSEAIPRYQEALTGLHHDAVAWLNHRGVAAEASDLTLFADTQSVIAFSTQMAGEITALASNAFLVLILVVFLLLEVTPFKRKLAVLLGASARLERFTRAAEMVQRYLFVKTGISLLVAVMVGLLLSFAGVDFAFLWALATFLLNYVPSIGPAIATIPSTAIAVLTLSPGAAVAVGAGQLTIHLIVGNVIEPRLMGGALGISTLMVFVSMLFWSWLWGPLGALFAVPLTLLLISLFELAPETRWIAVLLASKEWAEAKRIEWGWPPPDERKAQSSSGSLSAPLLSIAPPKPGTPAIVPNEATEKADVTGA
jgi:predicted PurR-regulated permease PerM